MQKTPIDREAEVKLASAIALLATIALTDKKG